MTANDVLSLLEGVTNDEIAKGTKTVELEQLRGLLAKVRSMVKESKAGEPGEVAQARLQEYRARLDVWVENHKLTHEWDLEMFRSVLTAAHGALKALLLINGGAAVALLAYVGHLVEKGQQSDIALMSAAMAIFVGGVFAGGLASVLTYITQWLYHGKHNRSGMVGNLAAILAGVVSLGLFCWGGYRAHEALITRPAVATVVSPTLPAEPAPAQEQQETQPPPPAPTPAADQERGQGL